MDFIPISEKDQEQGQPAELSKKAKLIGRSLPSSATGILVN